MKKSTRILAGLFAIVVSAALFVAGEFFLGGEDVFMNPGADPTGFADLVSGTGFAVYAARGVIGVFLEALGFIALYLYLENSRVERTAFWGMLLSVLGDFAGASFFGTMLFVYPRVAPYVEGTPELAAALAVSPVLFGVMGVATFVGLILVAVAVWRSGVLPRWAGVLMLVGFLVLPVQVFAVQILGNALWGLGGLWISVHAWKTRRTWAGREATGQPDAIYGSSSETT